MVCWIGSQFRSCLFPARHNFLPIAYLWLRDQCRILDVGGETVPRFDCRLVAGQAFRRRAALFILLSA
jgi:hypothetical protein